MGFLNPGRRVKQGTSLMQGRAGILGMAKDMTGTKGKARVASEGYFSGL